MNRSLPALLLGALLLSGCAAEKGAKGEAAAGGNRPADAVESEAPSDEQVEDAAEEEAKAPGPLTFGETFVYENGLAITVSKPKPFTPSDTAAVPEQKPAAYVAFDITIVNNSSENYDPAAWYGTLQSANTEAEKVYDSAQLGEEPTTTVLPGREAAFEVAFAVQDPADLVMEVTVGIVDYDAALFTS